MLFNLKFHEKFGIDLDSYDALFIASTVVSAKNKARKIMNKFESLKNIPLSNWEDVSVEESIPGKTVNKILIRVDSFQDTVVSLYYQIHIL